MTATVVERLRSHLEVIRNGYRCGIAKSPTIKDAHIYCVLNSVPPQSYGPLLESYIIDALKFTRCNPSGCSGDCKYESNGVSVNVEIKVSLGGMKHDRFNFVQLRPSHEVDAYLLTAYSLTLENLHDSGELFIFFVSKNDMINLISKYGSYAHGTISKNGRITKNNIENSKHEYAIRTLYGDRCWTELQKFRVHTAQ